MAKRCIFCGKEYGLFGGGLITCGDTDQPVCSNCSGNLSQLSPTERAERALATGRALHPDELQKFLVWDRKHKSAPARSRHARPFARTRPVCGAEAPWKIRNKAAPFMRRGTAGSDGRAVRLVAKGRDHPVRPVRQSGILSS